MIKTSIPKLRDQVWREFSKYIRRRDCKGRNYLNCITCGASVLFEEAQAGHFKHGKNTLTYFDEDNVHGQCVKCNMYLNGNGTEYALILEDMVGREAVDKIREENKRKHIWKREELETLKERYKALNELGHK